MASGQHNAWEWDLFQEGRWDQDDGSQAWEWDLFQVVIGKRK